MTRCLELLAIAAALALILAGLGCGQVVKIPERVYVPTAVPCVDQAGRPRRPALRSDAEILALDDYKVIQALRADRGKALEHADRLEAIVEICSRIPGPSSSSSSVGGVPE